jgi:hypothetical protein
MMIEYKLLTKMCNKCGAPLIQKGDDLFCPYCQTTYKIPNEYVTPGRNPQQPAASQLPAITLTRIPSRRAAQNSVPVVNKPKSNNLRKFFALIFLLAVFMGFILLLPKIMPFFNDPNKPIHETNQASQVTLEYLVAEPQRRPPSSFVTGTPLSFHTFIGTASAAEFTISVEVQNMLERNIEANLKADQMIILSASVVDNIGNTYICNYENSFTGTTDVIRPGAETTLGYIHCNPGMFPEVKFVKVNIALSNWGTYDFQIPLDSIAENLTVSDHLNRGDDGFHYTIDISSVPPQYIGIYFNDISAIDDKGNAYKPNHCSDGSTMSSTEFRFYSSIGTVRIYCEFDQPIPYEANSITFILNNRGNTITKTTTLDTIR